jgi:hypothetical protein
MGPKFARKLPIGIPRMNKNDRTSRTWNNFGDVSITGGCSDNLSMKFG